MNKNLCFLWHAKSPYRMCKISVLERSRKIFNCCLKLQNLVWKIVNDALILCLILLNPSISHKCLRFKVIPKVLFLSLISSNLDECHVIAEELLQF